LDLCKHRFHGPGALAFIRNKNVPGGAQKAIKKNFYRLRKPKELVSLRQI
jgi:hypothetical protein